MMMNILGLILFFSFFLFCLIKRTRWFLFFFIWLLKVRLIIEFFFFLNQFFIRFFLKSRFFLVRIRLIGKRIIFLFFHSRKINRFWLTKYSSKWLIFLWYYILYWFLFFIFFNFFNFFIFFILIYDLFFCLSWLNRLILA